MICQDNKHMVTLFELETLFDEHKQELKIKGERPTSKTLAAFLLTKVDVLNQHVLNISLDAELLQTIVQSYGEYPSCDGWGPYEEGLITLTEEGQIDLLARGTICHVVRQDCELDASEEDEENEEEEEEESEEESEEETPHVEASAPERYPLIQNDPDTIGICRGARGGCTYQPCAGCSAFYPALSPVSFVDGLPFIRIEEEGRVLGKRVHFLTPPDTNAYLYFKCRNTWGICLEKCSMFCGSINCVDGCNSWREDLHNTTVIDGRPHIATADGHKPIRLFGEEVSRC